MGPFARQYNNVSMFQFIIQYNIIKAGKAVQGTHGIVTKQDTLCLFTLGEPMSGKHLHCAANINDEEGVRRVLQAGSLRMDILFENVYPEMLVQDFSMTTPMDQVRTACCYFKEWQTSKKTKKINTSRLFTRSSIIHSVQLFGSASWESRDKGSSTAMHWAADGGHLSVIDYMLHDGCKIDVKDNISLWTPLMRVSAVTGNADVASLLVKAGADVNRWDKNGKTPP
ncbi:FANK1 protein, partial [Polyodon spathula]|nr:FANK1 protein [Polyodon spathula]